jgi:hypothetical protein
MTSVATSPPRIRLSILHLMLWTVGSAIILACFRMLSRPPDEQPSEVARLQPFYHLAYSLTLGAQVGSVLLFAVRRLNRQGGFPAQPGHWLLLVEGVSATLMLAGYGLFLLCFDAEPDNIYLFFALQIPNVSACAIGYGLAFTRTATASPWRLALATIAMVYGIQICLYAISAWTLSSPQSGGTWYGIWEVPQNCLGVTLGLTVLVGSLADWRNHAERDILHWAGIATFVGNIVVQFLYQMFVIGV